jgi:hypothetical protein
MRKHHLTLGAGLVLAAGLLGAAVPAIAAGALCPDLALQASPARLVSQLQSGLAALLGCGAD